MPIDSRKTLFQALRAFIVSALSLGHFVLHAWTRVYEKLSFSDRGFGMSTMNECKMQMSVLVSDFKPQDQYQDQDLYLKTKIWTLKPRQ